jgi:dTDP-glucose 4,6-dehydratase
MDGVIIINLDELTYAGNLESLQDVMDNERYMFVQGDICDCELVKGLLNK